MKVLLTSVTLLSLIICGSSFDDTKWLKAELTGFTLYYTSSDRNETGEYIKLFDNGTTSVSDFFYNKFNTRFNIYVHPDRASLDSSWQHDWGMPEFQSQCWMVASGVSDRFDILSPKVWDTQSCEHSYADKTGTQKLITHELVHVFHGQKNASPDFSDVQGIDWFVEGLATYASGQCDSQRISEVQIAVRENTIPNTLGDFWSGKLRYGLSGSVVMFIDRKYGRETLIDLLQYNHLNQVLKSLNTTQDTLLAEWRDYVLQIQF